MPQELPGTVNSSVGAVSFGSIINNQQTITTGQRVVINWNDFNVAGGSTLVFSQPNSSAVVLNRVRGAGKSSIDGSLNANGQVWLLNPNGVLIGSSGRIAAGGFVATTHALSNDDFLAGRHGFADAAAAGASVINAGHIVAAEGGYAVLAGREVANQGLIEARLGTVALGAAKRFTLDLAGDRLLSFAVAGDLDALPANAAAVTNRGDLRADGGRVLMSARAAASVVDSVINTSGLMQAQSVQLVDGRITLDGGNAGLVEVAGTLDTSGLASGERGGRVQVFGDTIILGNNAKLDARGDVGGGEVLVGGGWQGARIDGHNSAVRVAVAPGATLDASAITDGDGGMVVAWSDVANTASRTFAHGTFRATGGARGGDGGRIETSGHDLVTTGVTGSAAAPNGKAGTWLFDPYDIQIVEQFSASPSSEMLASDIVNLLNAGTNVAIDTANPVSAGASSAAAGDITVHTSITKTSGASTTLTLRAHDDIIVQPGADISSTAGGFNVVLTADSDNNGSGMMFLGGNIIATGAQSNGLIGIKYEGYFADNFSFFNTAQVQADARFNNPFTSVNGTTPGQNFDDTYSVRFFGFFKPSVSGTYNFRIGSDDASYMFLGSAGESVASLESRVTPGSATASAPGLHGLVFGSGNTTLTAGNLYPLLAYFGENGGGDVVIIDFTPPGGTRTENGTGFYFTNTGGGVTLNGNVQLIRDVTIGAQGGISFNGRVDSQTIVAGANPEVNRYTLTITNPTGAVNFAQAVGSINPLAKLQIGAMTTSTRSIATAAGGIELAVGQASTITGSLTGGKLATSGAGPIEWVVASTSDLNISGLELGGGPLNIKSSAPLAMSMPIVVTAPTALTFQTSGLVQLGSSIDGAFNVDIGTNGPLTFDGVVGQSIRPSRMRIGSLDVLTLVGRI